MHVIVYALGFIALVLAFEGLHSATASRSNHNRVAGELMF